MKFPANPEDGTVFSAANGQHYIYQKSTRSWIHAVGDVIFPLATPISDGLMAATDLRKINRIVVPAPNTTITADGCTVRYTSGNILMQSADNYLKIAGSLLLQNKNYSSEHKFRISQNTAGFDFTIDKDKLIDDLIASGQIKVIGNPGPKGKKGKKGPRGQMIATGPVGSKGDQGAAPALNLTITRDPATSQLASGNNKAIVDFDIQQVSDTEYKLIAKRSVIGNPDAAPNRVNLNCNSSSTWLVALTDQTDVAQSVYAVDVSEIKNTIYSKFNSEVSRLKAGHETIVAFWLGKMATLFYQQRELLCCTITVCEKTAASGGAITSAALLPQRAAALPELAIPDSSPRLMLTAANVGQNNAASIDVEPGLYNLEIADMQMQAGDGFSGEIAVEFAGKSTRETIRFPNPGSFKTPVMASRAYNNLTVQVPHRGGPLRAYINASVAVTGSLALRVVRVSDFSEPNNEFVYSADQMTALAQSWADKTAYGFVTHLLGQDYIVIKQGSVAVAWPTFDGETFMEWPDSITFKLDHKLNRLAKQNIASGDYSNVIGSGIAVSLVNNVWSSRDDNKLLADFDSIIFPIV